MYDNKGSLTLFQRKDPVNHYNLLMFTISCGGTLLDLDIFSFFNNFPVINLETIQIESLF